MDQQQQKSEEALEVLSIIASLLDTGLDKYTLRILVGLIEAGVHPEALAELVKVLRRARDEQEAPSQ